MGRGLRGIGIGVGRQTELPIFGAALLRLTEFVKIINIIIHTTDLIIIWRIYFNLLGPKRYDLVLF